LNPSMSSQRIRAVSLRRRNASRKKQARRMAGLSDRAL
jgi:hypothetical protein